MLGHLLRAGSVLRKPFSDSSLGIARKLHSPYLLRILKANTAVRVGTRTQNGIQHVIEHSCMTSLAESGSPSQLSVTHFSRLGLQFV